MQLPCPLWCDGHSDADTGTPGAFRLHKGAQFKAADQTLRLWRTDRAREGRPGPVRVVLEDIVELSAAEAADLAQALAEAARGASGADLARHENWCDPARHVQAASARLEGHAECVGRDLFVKIESARREVAGYWTQHSDGSPYFAAEWDFKTDDLTIGDLKSLYKLLTHATAAEIKQLALMVGDAIADFESGVQSDGPAPTGT